jgi:hypothetical protein
VTQEPPVRFASSMSVLSLSLCAVGAQWALWRRPTVFPLSSGLWWATTGTVLALWALVMLGVVAVVTRSARLAFTVSLGPGVLLVVGAVTGRFVFPQTAATVFVVPFVLGVVWLALSLRVYRSVGLRRQLTGLGVMTLALGPLGAAQVLGRAPAPPDTRPLLVELPAPGETSALPIDVACGPGHLSVNPLLSFQDASDDGFWPIARTPTVLKALEPPALSGAGRRAALVVKRSDATLELDAATHVPTRLASHLSRYTTIAARGFTAPSLAFGPTGARRFAVEAFDYPRGRPVSFGARTAEGDFVVWRATSAEKGPFHELGRGPLASTDALSMTLFDGDVARCRVTWLDFAAQADTSLSPTAGEGIPVNVVQFGRPAEDEAQVLIIASLAATGIGEGLDTVWLSAGVYRNRLLVEPVGQSTP